MKILKNILIVLTAAAIVYLVTITATYLILSDFCGGFINYLNVLAHPLSLLWLLYIVYVMTRDEVKGNRKVNS